MRVLKIIILLLTHTIYFAPLMIFSLVGIGIALFTYHILRFEVGYDISKTKVAKFLMKPLEWVEDKCI